MPRYFEYDYDLRRVTEYERQGACNQCGDCCRAEIAYRVQGVAQDADRGTIADGGPATTGAGIWQVCDEQGQLHCYQVKLIQPDASACSVLAPDGRCLTYPERNSYCRRWPLSPSDVQPFTHCGFTFVPVGNWALEDLQEAP